MNETYRIVSVAGIRSYKLASGLYASVSACLDHISTKRFLPDQEYLDRGTVLHAWATACLRGTEDSYDLPEGYGPDDYELYIKPVVRFFIEKEARFKSLDAVMRTVGYRIAGRPDVVATILDINGSRDVWIIDLKFAESLIERYEFQLHGYRMMDGLGGCRMGLLQVTRAGKLRFVEVDYDQNKTTLIASASNILRWQTVRAARDLTDNYEEC